MNYKIIFSSLLILLIISLGSCSSREEQESNDGSSKDPERINKQKNDSGGSSLDLFVFNIAS